MYRTYLEKAQLYINSGYVHRGYDEKEKLRNFYLQMITGDEIDNLLPQFERRESKDLWEQRKELTIENLSPVTNRVMNYFYKVSRTPKNAKVTCKDATKNAYIQEIVAEFYEDASVDKYISNVIDTLGLIDPNAFLAIDCKPFAAGEIPEPYPVIFDCTEVRDYAYRMDGGLDYLFVRLDPILFVKAQETTELSTRQIMMHDYYMFFEGGVINFIQQNVDREIQPMEGDFTWEANNGLRFTVRVIFTGSEKVDNQVPAIRLGYLKHKKYRNICISPLQAAKPLFKELIRRKSGLDLSVENHVHPQLFIYAEPCPGEVHIDPNRKCINGFIAESKQRCSVCNGDGLKPIRSAQEYIKIPVPKSVPGTPNIPIDKWAYYNSPDMFPVEYLDKRIELLEQKVLEAIFNTDHTKKVGGKEGQSSGGEKTATEVFLKRDAINNTLKPFADHRATIYRFIGKTIGILFDVEVTSVFEYTTQKFEPVTFEELIATLKALMDAGADEILIDQVQFQLALIALESDEEQMKIYSTQRKFLPFRGKSQDQITLLLSLDVIPREMKILWGNFAQIWQELEQEKGGDVLYDLDFRALSQLIKDKVVAIMANIDAQNPMLNVTGLAASQRIGAMPESELDKDDEIDVMQQQPITQVPPNLTNQQAAYDNESMQPIVIIGNPA